MLAAIRRALSRGLEIKHGDIRRGAADFLNQKPTPIIAPLPPPPPVLCPPPEYDEACARGCAAGRSRFACWGGEGSSSLFRRDPSLGLLFRLGFSSSF